MKRLLFSALFFAVTVIANAQTFAIKNVPSTSEDYKLLLEAKGYKSFAFDVTSLKYWYDEEIQRYRFCGDDILTDDMTSSLLTDVKEYYIIGMKVHK